MIGAYEVCLLSFPKYWIYVFITSFLMVNYFIYAFLVYAWMSNQSLEQSD